MKYLAAAVIAIPLGFAAFLLWPVDYDGQAAGIMQVTVFEPMVTVASIVATAAAIVGLSMVSIGRLVRSSGHARQG